MDTAVHSASTSKWQPRILIFLAITTLFAGGCSNFLRPSQPEDLSPETQARVASSLQQNPPPESASRYPRGVPYQSLSNEEKRRLETEVIPSLYEAPPPAAASEPPPAAMRPTTSATPGRRPQPGWTPYRQLSAEEQAFLEQEVMPRLMPGATSPPAQQRATATVSRPAPPAPVTAPATTTPAEQPAEQATAATAPAETPPPDTTPQTATAPGPRRDKLDDAATEDLPGPRVEKLESTTRAPDEEPILPAPQTVPEPTTPAPTPQQPAVPATPTGDTDTRNPPRPGAMPQAGEAVASADDDTEN